MGTGVVRRRQFRCLHRKKQGEAALFFPAGPHADDRGATCVDYVFPFSERTFSLSLFLLRPSVLARGVDAAVKGFPEKRAAASLGIEVKRIGREKRASSSKLRDILRQGPATKT